jgi:D-glycero-D-manno-heptose 1,7-bisphosphate phosphatase
MSSVGFQVSFKALFLDRDGVINVDYGYVHKISDFKFKEGIFSLARKAIEGGYYIFVVTNQAGIGRGYYTENDFFKVSDWMCKCFLEHGAPISKVYFAPTHPVKGLGMYKVTDNRRKPNPGMILEAMRDFDIDVQNSVLIGDKATDILAGLAAGVGCNIFLGKNHGLSDETDTVRTISSLSQAEQYI